MAASATVLQLHQNTTTILGKPAAWNLGRQLFEELVGHGAVPALPHAVGHPH